MFIMIAKTIECRIYTKIWRSPLSFGLIPLECANSPLSQRPSCILHPRRLLKSLSCPGVRAHHMSATPPYLRVSHTGSDSSIGACFGGVLTSWETVESRYAAAPYGRGVPEGCLFGRVYLGCEYLQIMSV